MNKAELAEAIVSKLSLETKKMGYDIVEGVFDIIKEKLGKGEEVAIAGFGAFKVADRKARAGVNPKTGEKIQIAATKVPKFKAGKELKMLVK
ncbi:MAG: HU family DNA-binding protein [Patescibacteria group bacterium]